LKSLNQLLLSKYPLTADPFWIPPSFEEDIDEDLSLKLTLEFSKRYPLENPKFQFVAPSKVPKAQLADIEQLIKTVINKNIGNPMVFEIVEDIRKWIQINVLNEEQRARFFGAEEEDEVFNMDEDDE